MIKRNSLNLVSIICLVSAVYFVCYALSLDDILPISIYSVWSYTSQWSRHFHVLAVGLLPVYVALMVFGTAVAGVYLGSVVHRWIRYFLCQK